MESKTFLKKFINWLHRIALFVAREKLIIKEKQDGVFNSDYVVLTREIFTIPWMRKQAVYEEYDGKHYIRTASHIFGLKISETQSRSKNTARSIAKWKKIVREITS